MRPRSPSGQSSGPWPPTTKWSPGSRRSPPVFRRASGTKPFLEGRFCGRRGLRPSSRHRFLRSFARSLWPLQRRRRLSCPCRRRFPQLFLCASGNRATAPSLHAKPRETGWLLWREGRLSWPPTDDQLQPLRRGTPSGLSRSSWSGRLGCWPSIPISRSVMWCIATTGIAGSLGWFTRWTPPPPRPRWWIWGTGSRGRCGWPVKCKVPLVCGAVPPETCM
mmetsp:Transcript_103380/g.236912  ORF Transcript_103380/g.236912 Transcript_103380/m.236912 type:complete len:220 (-) Transcript_103380:1177-1836(-)